MEEQRYILVQCGVPFIYKPVYFAAPSRFSANTWNFMFTQNKSDGSMIKVTNRMDEEKRRNSVLLSGKRPINYKRLSKRRLHPSYINYNFMTLEDIASYL